MVRLRTVLGLTTVLLALHLDSAAHGQTLVGPYAGPYTLVDLGSVPGVPTNYGGLCFLNNNTMLIGGAANTGAGKIYSITVVRNGANQITGFSGVAAVYKNAPDIDGGLTFDSAGVLLCVTFPSNNLLMYKVGGGINPDKSINLTGPGVASSTGGIVFVPAGFPGAGGCRLISYSSDKLYSCTLTPDGLGTYNLSAVTLQGSTAAGSGPEGWVYAPAGSPVFNPANKYGIFPEYLADRVSAYQLTPAGYPMLATRTDFVTGLTGAEGGFLDPLTNDFLFSTFGGSNKVIRVTGFAAPPVPPPPPGAPGSSGGVRPGEGSIPLSGGQSGGSEGTFGYGTGFNGMLASAGTTPPRMPILLGPLPDRVSQMSFHVLNVSQRPTAPAVEPPGDDTGLGPLAWTLLAGLALGLVALTVKVRPT